MNHEHYMREALKLAKEASEDGESPVGCVVVAANGEIVGKGRNRREREKCATAHAEIEAIRDACESIGDWRLSGCSMYVTLEPCPMCAGAVIMSRISRLYYGARDELTGSCGGAMNLFMELRSAATQVTGGVLAEECSALLSGFFNDLRS